MSEVLKFTENGEFDPNASVRGILADIISDNDTTCEVLELSKSHLPEILGELPYEIPEEGAKDFIEAALKTVIAQSAMIAKCMDMIPA